jgi:glyoxylate reductase
MVMVKADNKPRVLVTLPLPEAVLTSLAQEYVLEVWSESNPIPATRLSDWLADCDGVLCGLSTRFDQSVFQNVQLPKVISSISVGVDHIDLTAATARQVAVGHTPGVLVDSTADLALGLMLAVTRRLVEGDRLIREGGWQSGWSTGFFLGTDLSRATVGLVGLGPIGQAVARRLQAFGARVIAWNRTPRVVEGVEMVDLDTLFGSADIVSLHTALTDDTRSLVNRARLAQMRDGSVLINTARGGLVDEQALAEELANGRLKAGLDVYQEEPLPLDSPLLGCREAVLAPHVGSATAATRLAMLERAMLNLAVGLRGETLPFCANPEVYAK